MSQIDEPIPESATEQIRDRIALIIAQEMWAQAQWKYDDDLLVDVYLERTSDFNHSEVPAVNVMYADSDMIGETLETQDGLHTFFIDVYTKASSTGTGVENRADRLAGVKLHKLLHVINKILMHKKYKRLLFAAPFISNRRVASIKMTNPQNPNDTTSTVWGRIEFTVRAPEDQLDVLPTTLEGIDTQIQLDESARGYLWGNNDVTPAVPVCDPGTVTNSDASLSIEVASGGTYELTDITLTINGTAAGSFPAGVDIDTNVTIQPEVYYNRSWLVQSVSAYDHDEAYRRINGGNDYRESIPDNAVVQEIYPDIVNNRHDYLKYFNKWGHKFRFTGENGGYYDEADGNYYDKDGNLSDLATAYPVITSARYWVYDHLTGLKWPSHRLGATTFEINVTDITTYTWVLGFVPAWVIPSHGEALQLRQNDTEDQVGSLNNQTNRPFFAGYTGVDNWTCSRFAVLAHYWTYQYANNTGTQFVNANPASISANRWFMVIFEETTIPQP